MPDYEWTSRYTYGDDPEVELSIDEDGCAFDGSAQDFAQAKIRELLNPNPPADHFGVALLPVDGRPLGATG
ncbi:hypothetical protein [Streptacidiphilus sp. PAMC 29251]